MKFMKTEVKELTLEDVQVDCRGLSDSKIKRIAGVFKGYGINLISNYDSLTVTSSYNYIRLNAYNSLGVLMKDNSKKTITYDEFMDIFNSKEKQKQGMKIKSGWYKTPNGNEKWLCYFDLKNRVFFGFDYKGEWFNPIKINFNVNSGQYYKCSDEEVTERLKAESIKRGFKQGVTVENKHQGQKELISFDLEKIVFRLELNVGIWYRQGKGIWLMCNGIWSEIISQESETKFWINEEYPIKEVLNPQQHYDNKSGSLYKLADELGLNHYEFDVLKRIVRCRKKGQFREDLNKIKDSVDIYLREFKE